ncbi:metal ABC transporter permease [Alkalihalobacillus trypoxylicola]|uniref:Metal ABC transporter permease n=1 Tax=Alkalihalobacillus trypoxylicola TaxID=519424 RepID=A0A162ENY7_9BACI|nr:metal ABC transporter permease [Alkalihalobacillus trypoxylicola]KYG33376.1 metal ABC transporter permease [Alkalihalobacillus trypoxylicola]
MIEVFFQFDFLRNALFSGILVGIIAPMIGVFLVVKRMSLIADALSHITLTGIAFHLLLASFFVSLAPFDPIYMGVVFAILGAIFIDKLRKVYEHFKELSIPIILSLGIGVGVIFISMANGFNTDLFAYLFGSIAAVGQNDLLVIMVVSIFTVISLILFYKEWFFLAFDSEQAQTSGISKNWLDLIFTIIVALVIAAAIRIVGILLISALMTLPVSAAIQWSKSFKQMFIYSIIFGELSVLIGLFLGYHLNLAPGGVIVVVGGLFLFGSILAKKILNKYNISFKGVKTSKAE